MSPAVYALPVGGRWLVHAPHAGISALMNGAALREFDRCALDREHGAAPDLRTLWTDVAAVGEPAGPGNAPEDSKLVILPTRACNMRCVYCDFEASVAPGRHLDPRLACRLVDRQVAHALAAGARTVRVHFFGGEPLVGRRCVETVVHYTRMVCARAGLAPWFEITTNGLFDDSAIPFLGDYMDSVVVSLDGPRAEHDRNRPTAGGRGTHAVIADRIRRLGGYPAELSLRACITARTVGSMADIAREFCTAFQFDLLAFEMLTPTPQSRRAGLEAPDPLEFAAGLLEAEREAGAFGVGVVHGPSELCSPRATSCPLGAGTLVLDPDGRVTGCYLPEARWRARGLDLALGRAGPKSVQIDAARLAQIGAVVRDKARCARCFCRHTCAGGCHVDQTPPGCSPEYDDKCLATRAITAGRLLRRLPGAEPVPCDAAALRVLATHDDDRIPALRPPPSAQGLPC